MIPTIFKNKIFLNKKLQLNYNSFQNILPHTHESTNISPRFLIILVSCQKEKHRWKSYLSVTKNSIIICGTKMQQDYLLNKRILYLNCNDNYEGLPEKMICAINAILNIDKFKNITHIIKIDAHDNLYSKNIVETLSLKTEINNYDYLGQCLNKVTRTNNRTWHFNKVSHNSLWHDKKYDGEFVDWLDGGSSYVLSKKALKNINTTYSCKDISEVSQKYIYEDLMIAQILRKYNIFPKQIYYGLRGDKINITHVYKKMRHRLYKI